MKINIEVNPGQVETVIVYEGENPQLISRAFA
jgi:hypothetical protein